MFLEYFLHMMKLDDNMDYNSEKSNRYNMLTELLVICFFILFYMSSMFSPICRTEEKTYYARDIY
mgnify:CR=1 FL=1